MHLIAEGGDAVARHREGVRLEAAVGGHAVSSLGGGGAARGGSRAGADGRRGGAEDETSHRFAVTLLARRVLFPEDESSNAG